MIAESSVWTIFCDDVRQEIGNKVSYMGTYGPNLLVPEFPTTLLKLCAVIHFRSPIKAIPEDVVVRVFRDDQLLMEQELQMSKTAEALQLIKIPEDSNYCMSVAVAQLVNFALTESCWIKVRALVDGIEVQGGRLLIDRVPKQD